jgi:hypothetical protein
LNAIDRHRPHAPASARKRLTDIRVQFCARLRASATELKTRARIAHQPMRTRTKAAALAAAVVLVLVLVLVAAGPHRCFLDLLNAQVARSCTFERFYAGVPGRPSTREFIPELGDLEDAFPAVQAEALRVFDRHLAAQVAGGEGVPRMDATYNQIFMRSAGARGGLFGRTKAALTRAAMRAIYGKDVEIFDKIGGADWRTFNLVLFGRDVPGNAEQCPELVRHLRRVPGMQSALISIIAPGTYIPPHSDPAKGVIRYHLAFKVPADRANCFIEVGGERYHWAEGAGVVFDDVFDHWVRNATDEYRVILFVDLLRPMRGLARRLQGLANAANRWHPGVRRLIAASRVELSADALAADEPGSESEPEPETDTPDAVAPDAVAPDADAPDADPPDAVAPDAAAPEAAQL